MSDITNLMRREQGRAATGLHPTCGIVTSYDPDTHTIKVKHQPDGVLSGAIPIVASGAGDGLSVVHGPSIGDQAIIHYINGDRRTPICTGFIHSRKNRPPRVESGEVLVRHSSGANIRMSKDKSVSMTDGEGGTVRLDGAGALEFRGKNGTKISVAADGGIKIGPSISIATDGTVSID